MRMNSRIQAGWSGQARAETICPSMTAAPSTNSAPAAATSARPRRRDRVDDEYAVVEQLAQRGYWEPPGRCRRSQRPAGQHAAGPVLDQP
jgi:hypothetical protein